MPDLLAHALLAYLVGTLLSWRYAWLDQRWVTVVVIGAFIPDLVKIRLVVPQGAVQALFGDIPFSLTALHTAGLVLLSILVGVLFAAPRYRKPVFAALATGAASHLLADALILNPSGRSYAILWPLTRLHPPSPGLYLSTQLWPTAVAAGLAAAVWVADRRLEPAPDAE